MKKMLSVLMAIVLVFSWASAFALAYENGVSITDMDITNAPYLVNSTGSAEKTGSGNVAVKDGSAYMVYKVPMPRLDANQVFDSFTVSLVTFDDQSRDHTSRLYLYKLPGENRDVTTMTTETISEYVGDYATYCAGSVINKAAADTSAKNYRYTLDITDYANECRGQSVMYFAAAIYGMTSNIWYSTADAYKPTYSFTPSAAPELTLDSAAPSDGAEITADTEVSFTYSNIIASANVTLNGKQAAASVSGNKITLTEDLNQATAYSLTITVTDEFSASHTYTMNFSTIIGKTETTANASVTKIISTSEPAAIAKGASEVNGGKYAYLKMPLPAVGSDGMLDEYTVTLYAYRTSTPNISVIKVYKLAGEAWDDTTLKTSDTAFAAIIADYNTYGIENSVSYVSAGASNNDHIIKIDLTQYAASCLANGQSDMCIAVTSDEYLKIYGNSNWTGQEYKKPQAEAVVINKAEIVPYEVSLNTSGAALNSYSFKLLTPADNANSYVKLVKADTNEEITASFTYNTGKRTVSLESAVALLEKTTYRVVLESGFTDDFGNTLTEDMVISEFTTGLNFETALAKIVASDGAAEYDDAAGLTSVALGGSYKCVTKVTNSTSDDVDFVVAIAVYNSSNELISFSFETKTAAAGTSAQSFASSAAAIEDGAQSVKAFVWDKNYNPFNLPAFAQVQ